jgi:GH24 family phage-related lysozyme (muramidase)
MASRKQAAIIGASVLIFSGTAAFEGLVTHPNPDPANPRLLQVCFGDTEVEMRNYTVAQCHQLLELRLQRDYTPKVLACVPTLIDRRNELAAGSDGAYNGGAYAFCHSPMAALWNRKQWTAGANAFLHWHTMPGTRVHYGVMARRYFEQCVALNLGSTNYCVHYGFTKAATLRRGGK